MEIGIKIEESVRIETVQIKEKSQEFEIDLSSRPDEVKLDPELWLLHNVQ